MSIKDYYKMFLLNSKRTKKKWGYILIILICVCLSLGLFLFQTNVNKIIDVTLKQNIGYRTIMVYPRTKQGQISTNGEATEFSKTKLDEDYQKDIEEILEIDHVLDSFDSSEWEIVLSSSFASNDVDGTITLFRGTSKTNPTVIEGRNFEIGETGVALCPKYFYPNFNPLQIDKNKIIDGSKILNTIFSVQYNDYIFDNFLKLQKNNTFEKEFKIVGLYDNSERMNDSGVCYISSNDMSEIVKTENSLNEMTINGIAIIVDDVENIEYVIDQVEKKGFTNPELRAYLDVKMINVIRLSIAIVFSIVLSTIIVLTSSYVKKRINFEEKTIGILRASGFSKKIIMIMYMLELFLTNLIVFIVGAILFSIIFFVSINNIGILISANLMLGGIKFSFSSMILSFIIICLVPCVIMYIHVKKRLKQNIVTLIGSGE